MTVPDSYVCSACSVRGCKLWRPSASSRVELKCAWCALADQRRKGEVDADGMYFDEDIGVRTDQIWHMCPNRGGFVRTLHCLASQTAATRRASSDG